MSSTSLGKDFVQTVSAQGLWRNIVMKLNTAVDPKKYDTALAKASENGYNNKNDNWRRLTWK